MKAKEAKKRGRPKGSKNKKKESFAISVMKRNPFFILWNPEGTTPPTVTFNKREEAEAVAESMQKRIGAGNMFVLKAVGVVVGTLSLKKEVIA